MLSAYFPRIYDVVFLKAALTECNLHNNCCHFDGAYIVLNVLYFSELTLLPISFILIVILYAQVSPSNSLAYSPSHSTDKSTFNQNAHPPASSTLGRSVPFVGEVEWY